MNLRRLAPLGGPIFVAAAVSGIVILGGNTPGIGASPAEIVAFYTAHGARQSAAAYVVTVGVAFLALFAGGAYVAMTKRGVGSSLWRVMFLCGAAISATGFLVAAVLHLALSEAVRHHAAPEAAQALNALDAEDFLLFAGGLGIMLLGAAGMMIPAAGRMQWLGWAALPIGVLFFTPLGFVAFLAAALWLVVAGFALTSMGDESTSAPGGTSVTGG